MFTYCLNNPTNFIDNSGTDAVWIQEAERADGNGHSGLLVDDGNGNWYFLYWGAAGNGSLLQKILGTAYDFVFIKIDVTDCDLYSVDGVTQALSNSENQTAQIRSQFVTGTYYLSGDYSATYDYLSEMATQEAIVPGSLGKYELLTRNCAQTTWHALAYSNERLLQNACPIIPNNAFIKVQMLNDMHDLTYRMWHDFQLY
jgi:hypothetical protein